MEARLASKFITDSSQLLEADTRTDLQRLLLAAIGDPRRGTQLEVTVTIKTVPNAPAWVPCKQLGYYGESPCNRLNPPHQPCPEDHYHRPAWVTHADGAEFCATCESLGLTPSRDSNAQDYYNHRGAVATT